MICSYMVYGPSDLLRSCSPLPAMSVPESSVAAEAEYPLTASTSITAVIDASLLTASDTALNIRLSTVCLTFPPCYSIRLMILAGTPPTMQLAGTSLVTTAPAATMELSPIVTPFVMVELEPTQTLLPRTMGAG